jgi:hypothetical protein
MDSTPLPAKTPKDATQFEPPPTQPQAIIPAPNPQSPAPSVFQLTYK